MNDKRLINKLKSGDEKALSKIMDKYTSYAYTIAMNIIGSYMQKEDVEEIVSDSFVSLWSNASGLREDCELSPYIAAIVRNQSKNKLRKLRADLSYDELLDMIPDGSDFQQQFDIMETTREIVSAVREILKPEEREIFIRHYFYGEKLEPIADESGLTLSNCKTKLYRAKIKVRKYLIERGYGCDEK